MKNHVIQTRDIYESCYFLTKGANILTVEPIYENNKLVCAFTFSGENLLKAQNDYYNARAEVNLWEFRRSFSRINSLIGTARKEYNQKLKSSETGEAFK